jgi:hypothetical protein
VLRPGASGEKKRAWARAIVGELESRALSLDSAGASVPGRCGPIARASADGPAQQATRAGAGNTRASEARGRGERRPTPDGLRPGASGTLAHLFFFLIRFLAMGIRCNNASIQEDRSATTPRTRNSLQDPWRRWTPGRSIWGDLISAAIQNKVLDLILEKTICPAAPATQQYF